MRRMVIDFGIGVAATIAGGFLLSDLRSESWRTAGYVILALGVLSLPISLYKWYPKAFGIRWRYAATALVFRDDQVLLVFHPVYGVYLAPGHRVGFQEYPHEAVLAAVTRETGYIVTFNKTIHAEERPIGGTRHTWQIPQPYAVIREDHERHRGGIRTHYDFVYVCDIVGEKTEFRPVMNYRWFKIAELASLVSVRQLWDDVQHIVEDAHRALSNDLSA